MSRQAPRSGGGLSLQTLLISSLAAVAAAVVVPMFWEKGSLFATAVTPVVVALVSEALNRPAAAVKSVAPRVARRTATGAAVRSQQPTGVGARGEGPEQVPGGISPEDPFGLRTAQRRRRRLPVRAAVITGLLAAVIGAGVVTASELALFSHSVGNGRQRTSLWGGKPAKQKHQATRQEQASPTPEGSATPTPSATASPSATPSPSATASPTPSAQAAPSTTPTPTP